jgi:ABC-type dipeptide/oligopeptide/nickel transport system ATPase component
MFLLNANISGQVQKIFISFICFWYNRLKIHNNKQCQIKSYSITKNLVVRRGHMEIFSLSGQSGTGKSTSALTFAHQQKISAIVDDGLLIFNGQRIAGTSAKFEKNIITAVKRATFFFEDHVKEVQMAIHHYYINRILIIGTSDRMTRIIAARLQLGEIDYFFHVEDIRSSSEIKIAQFVRKTEGKHIIPIPYKQVNQNFFKKIILKGREIISSKQERIGETTIVHPDFHHSRIIIHTNVYKDIVKIICQKYREIEDCKSAQFQSQGLPILNVTITIKQPIRTNLIKISENLQNEIQSFFLKGLNIELYSINLTIQVSKKAESLPVK